MTDLAHLKFYATQPHDCSYLEQQQAVTLFLDPAEPIDEEARAKTARARSAAARVAFVIGGDRAARTGPRAAPA